MKRVLAANLGVFFVVAIVMVAAGHVGPAHAWGSCDVNPKDCGRPTTTTAAPETTTTTETPTSTTTATTLPPVTTTTPSTIVAPTTLPSVTTAPVTGGIGTSISQGPQLPFTGSSVLTLALIGLGSFVVGFGLTVYARRWLSR